MMLKTQLWFGAWLLTLMGCASQQRNATQEEANAAVVWSDQNITIGAEDALDGLVTAYEYIPLETTPQCLLGEIRDVQWWQNRLYVSAGSPGAPAELFVFDHQGHFLHKIGSIGRGPQEYLYLGAFTVDTVHQRVILLDNNAMQLYQYAIDGSFVSKTVADSTLKFARTLYCTSDQQRLALFDINFRSQDLYRSYSLDFQPNALLASSPYTFGGASSFAIHSMSYETTDPLLLKPLNDTLFTYRDDHLQPLYINQYKNQGKTFTPPSTSDYEQVKQECSAQDFAYPYSLLENRDYIALVYLDGTILWNKKQKKGLYCDQGSSGDHIAGYPLSFLELNFGHDDTFVQLQSAMAFRAKASAICQHHPNPQLTEALQHLQDEDNPVLLIYHLKDSFN